MSEEWSKIDSSQVWPGPGFDSSGNPVSSKEKKMDAITQEEINDPRTPEQRNADFEKVRKDLDKALLEARCDCQSRPHHPQCSSVRYSYSEKRR
jgi:hypothetical protein